MLTMMSTWSGSVEVNGEIFDSIDSVRTTEKTFEGDWSIKLLPKNRQTDLKSDNHVEEADKSEYRITVKGYMLKKATPSFDFMAKWNNDNPMPMPTMQGTKEKETRGMVYMHLHGTGEPDIYCKCCGRELTNPVSRHYGVGPICLGKLGITTSIDDIDTIKDELQEIKWSGWIIKSAITSEEKLS